jgi:hypothetical protein
MRTETDTDKANVIDGFFFTILPLLSHPLQIVCEMQDRLRRVPPNGTATFSFRHDFIHFRTMGFSKNVRLGFGLALSITSRLVQARRFLGYGKRSQKCAGEQGKMREGPIAIFFGQLATVNVAWRMESLRGKVWHAPELGSHGCVACPDPPPRGTTLVVRTARNAMGGLG